MDDAEGLNQNYNLIESYCTPRSHRHSSNQQRHPMFLRQLLLSAPCVLPQIRPPYLGLGPAFPSSLPLLPRCSGPGPPSWLLGRGVTPLDLPRWTCTSLHPSPFTRSLYTSPCAMERHDQGAAPPPKRRRSVEAEEEEMGEAKEASRSRGKKWGAPPHSPTNNGHATRGGGVVSTRDGRKEEEHREEGGGGGALRTPRSPKQEARAKPRPPSPSLKGGGGAGPAEEPPGRDLPPDSTNPWLTVGPGRNPPFPSTQGVAKTSRPLQRQWEVPPACSSVLQPQGANSDFDFSVLSYNILSQDLLQDNAYLYRHCDPAVLRWDYRLPRLLAEIQHYSADVLCLQEVQHDHYESQIKPVLQALGYQCEYKKRTGSKPDGLAVAYRKSRLSLLSSRPVEFLRAGDALLDRDNVGLVVLLQPAGQSGPSPAPCVCVANTHLLYNPRRGDVKLAQVAILLAEVQRMACLPDGSANPVLLCGDLNSAPWSPLYHLLTTGCLQYQGMAIGMVSGQEDSPRGQRLLESPIWSSRLGINQRCCYDDQPLTDSTPSPGVEGAASCLPVEDPSSRRYTADNRFRIEHCVGLQSSYQHVLMHDGKPEITTCHSRVAMTVDYIMYTPDSSPPSPLPGGRGLQLLGRLSLVGQSELEEVSGLPNQHHPSDHLPLLARFRLCC